MTNYEEWLAGTDPLDGASYLGIVSYGLQLTDAGVAESGAENPALQIVWWTVPGRKYAVEATDSLFDGWTNVSGVLTAEADQLTWTDTDTGASRSRRFYRVVVMQ